MTIIFNLVDKNMVIPEIKKSSNFEDFLCG